MLKFAIWIMPVAFSRIVRFLCAATLLFSPEFLRAETPAGNAVTINSDNVLLINGRKVFPLGLTMAPPPDAKTPDGINGLQELADAGMTFFRTGPLGKDKWDDAAIAREQQWEDAAAKHGLYCWLYLKEVATIGNNDAKKEALLRRIVNQFKDHPGLGLWKGADEPEWGKMKVAGLIRAHEIVRELDNNHHPLILMQAPRGTADSLRPYDAACDIIGLDIYPVSYPPGKNSLLANKELSMVGDYTKMMMHVSGGKMPVWMVLQIAWSGVVKKEATLRFPTFPEERFMVYQAIINGARGLNFFGGNLEAAMSPEDRSLGWNWTFWNRVLKPVILEIGTKSPLAPALVAPDSKLAINQNQGKAVEFCVREVGTDIYLLACKREGATVQVEFSGLPAVQPDAELMYESPRMVHVKDGKFTDWFGPFEVHVYHFHRAE
jgi:hypothetical protein